MKLKTILRDRRTVILANKQADWLTQLCQIFIKVARKYKAGIKEVEISFKVPKSESRWDNNYDGKNSYRGNGKFKIKVFDSYLPGKPYILYYVIEILTHEFTHAICWDHDSNFLKIYSEILLEVSKIVNLDGRPLNPIEWNCEDYWEI